MLPVACVTATRIGEAITPPMLASVMTEALLFTAISGLTISEGNVQNVPHTIDVDPYARMNKTVSKVVFVPHLGIRNKVTTVKRHPRLSS